MTHPILASVAALVALALPAHAADAPAGAPADPCARELLDDEAAFERNAWAHNCGYIPARAITWMFVHDLWVAFEAPGAPVDSEGPCSGEWGGPVAMCAAVID